MNLEDNEEFNCIGKYEEYERMEHDLYEEIREYDLKGRRVPNEVYKLLILTQTLKEFYRRKEE